MTNYPGATTTVTLTATVPTNVAEAAGLAVGADRASGAVHMLRHDDAVELVAAGVAQFGGPAGPPSQGVSRQLPIVMHTQAGAAYTLTKNDAGAVVQTTSAAAVTVTVPTDAAVPFPIGTIIELRQYGAGLLTVAPAAGVTIRSRGGALKSAGQYAAAKLIKRAGNEWWLSGDVVV